MNASHQTSATETAVASAPSFELPPTAAPTILPPVTKRVAKPRKPVSKKASKPYLIRPTVVAKPTRLAKMFGGVADFGRSIRNVVVGAGLSFLGNLPIFLDPVGFLFFNAHRIGAGILHLSIPALFAAAAIWQNPSLIPGLLSFDAASMGTAVSLYAFGTFAWMMTWLFIRMIGNGIANVLERFAKNGERKLPRAVEGNRTPS